ncbi:MAG: MotA/TolQ/ExbB proton channel family protein, partial [Acidobacteria bacterium]|nr:MotA/TolQ/ExbB proton channel family protein [Acidobacteriota bacterium]
MLFVDQLIGYMRKHDFQSIVLENDQSLSLSRADGGSASAKERFTLAQLSGFLDEILPNDRFRTLLAKGIPFRFPYACGGGAAAIEVHPGDGQLRITISLNQATAPTSPIVAAQSAATSPPVAEPAPPPSAVPASQVFHPATAAAREELPPHAAPVREEPPSAHSTASAAGPLVPRPHLAVPTKLSRILRLLETRLRALAAAVGLALGLITSALIYLLANKEGMLGHMFNLRSLPTAIPVAISCMFFWAATLCCLRWVRLRELERISTKSLLLQATQLLNATGPADLDEKIKGGACEASPLLRRLRAVLQQWAIRPSLQDADLILQQHVANDEESVRAGYNLVRTFIWALPVLGLIGTVIG